MTETKRYLPSQLKNIVKEFRMIKNPDSCEVITHQGKRCKNATKYRFGDEIKDCGSYCTKHSNVWIKDLFHSLTRGFINVDGKKVKSYKINMFPLVKFGHLDISIKNGYIKNVSFSDYIERVSFSDFIENEVSSPEFYYDPESKFYIKGMDIKKGVENEDIKLDDIVEFIIRRMSLSKSIDIEIEFEYRKKGKITNLDVDGIRGWYIIERGEDIIIKKRYNVMEK